MDDNLEREDFSDDDHIHNWRNYVGENVRAIWAILPEHVRQAIKKDAELRASNENWE